MSEGASALLAAFKRVTTQGGLRTALDTVPRIAAEATLLGGTSWRSLACNVAVLANELRAKGVRAGTRVGWIGPNDQAQIALFFACARLGAVQVPLNWRLAVEELRWIEADAGLHLVCAPVSAERRPDPWQHPYLDDLAARRDGGAPAVVDPVFEAGALYADGQLAADLVRISMPGEDAPLLLCYTSGTTGRPKGAALSQRAILANAAAAQAVFDLSPSDRVLTVLPMFHVGGLNIQTIPALLAGAEVMLMRGFDPDGFFAVVASKRPSLTLLVPAVMRALVAHPGWRSADLSSLRAIGAGSSEVPLDLIEAFHAKGIPVQQVYGATETGPVAIAQTRDEALSDPGSIGRPVPGVEARLAPHTNEIEIRGPNVTSGYWNAPEATAAALRDGWFATGDVGRVDEHCRWWFTDRLKHVIISGGENIYPAEVERVLATAPGIREGAVIGRPDPRWGEVPVAVVVPAPDFDAAQVLAHFDGRLARFKHPRDVVTLPALPRTALGKIAVAELKALAFPLPSREGAGGGGRAKRH